MRHLAFLLVLAPAVAWAQQTPVQQSNPPTLQQVLDQKSGQIADAVAAMRGQITQDQNTISTLTQQSAVASAKAEEMEKRANNLQAQLDAATKLNPTPK